MSEPQEIFQPVFPPTPATAQRDSVLVFYAIEQLISATRLHYRRIQIAARGISDLQESAESETKRLKQRANQVAIVADIGALIGTIQRLRGLVERLPGGSGMRLARRAFAASSKEVKEPRHHLEHLDSAIRDISESGQGAFGAVSWWYRTGEKEVKCSAFIPGTIAVGKGLFQTRAPKPESITEEVGHIWASIAGSHFNVSAVFWSVTELESRLREWGAAQAEEDWPAIMPLDRSEQP